MRIAEMFYSVQGEGKLTGVPSFFIRFAGCHLHCKWCDTPYALSPEDGTAATIKEIIAELEKYPECRHVVITGGEPMLVKELQELTALLKEMDMHITIETCGALDPAGGICDLASLSPKLSHSTPVGTEWEKSHENNRLSVSVIDKWLELYNCQLKFVVDNTSDIAEIKTLLAELTNKVDNSDVLLMPQGVDSNSLKEKSTWLVNECLKHGFRYCSRLHVDLFGNRKGV